MDEDSSNVVAWTEQSSGQNSEESNRIRGGETGYYEGRFLKNRVKE